MGMQSVQATKEKLVQSIISNPVYTEQSGVYQQLQHALLKLSKNDLSLLYLIIKQKEQHQESKQ